MIYLPPGKQVIAYFHLRGKLSNYYLLAIYDCNSSVHDNIALFVSVWFELSKTTVIENLKIWNIRHKLIAFGTLSIYSKAALLAFLSCIHRIYIKMLYVLSAFCMIYSLPFVTRSLFVFTPWYIERLTSWVSGFYSILVWVINLALPRRKLCQLLITKENLKLWSILSNENEHTGVYNFRPKNSLHALKQL